MVRIWKESEKGNVLGIPDVSAMLVLMMRTQYLNKDFENKTWQIIKTLENIIAQGNQNAIIFTLVGNFEYAMIIMLYV